MSRVSWWNLVALVGALVIGALAVRPAATPAVVLAAPVAYGAPVAYAAPVAYGAPVAYSAPIAAPVAYAAPIAAPVAYVAPVSYAAPGVTSHAMTTPVLGSPVVYSVPAY